MVIEGLSIVDTFRLLMLLPIGYGAYTDWNYRFGYRWVWVVMVIIATLVSILEWYTGSVPYTELGLSILGVTIFSIVFRLSGAAGLGDYKSMLSVAVVWPVVPTFSILSIQFPIYQSSLPGFWAICLAFVFGLPHTIIYKELPFVSYLFVGLLTTIFVGSPV